MGAVEGGGCAFTWQEAVRIPCVEGNEPAGHWFCSCKEQWGRDLDRVDLV